MRAPSIFEARGVYELNNKSLGTAPMKRPFLFIPIALALAAGTWILAMEDESDDTDAIASPGISAATTSNEVGELPLFTETQTPTTETQAQRDALKRPSLALQARSAIDGKGLPQARVIIKTKEQAASKKDYSPGAKRVRATPSNEEAPPKDGRPFSWMPAEAGAEKVPTSSTLSLNLSADGQSNTELEPGDWSVTFEAAGYVSQTREVSLALGDIENLEVSLLRAALVQGVVRDRFGRPIGGRRMLFIPQGVPYPRFPRDLQNVFTTEIDREGNITPISLPEDDYTIAYGNVGTATLQTQSRLKAGETNNLEVVFGGKSMVRFELDRSPEEKRTLELRLELQDKKKIERDQERLLRKPERADRAQEKGKSKEKWKTAGRANIREGVGELFNAKPGTYRVTLFARPGEYSSSTMLTLEADESVLVNVQLPVLPERSGARRNDPKTPKEGPLNISIRRNPSNPEWKQDGIYWR